MFLQRIWFNPRHLHSCSQPSMTPVAGNPLPFLTSKGTRHACKQNTHTYKLNKSLKKEKEKTRAVCVRETAGLIPVLEWHLTVPLPLWDACLVSSAVSSPVFWEHSWHIKLGCDFLSFGIGLDPKLLYLKLALALLPSLCKWWDWGCALPYLV